MFQYKAKIERIVDGDTLWIDVDLGFFLRQKMHLRLWRVDTPEIRGIERPEGLRAKQYVTDRLPPGSIVVVKTYKVEKYGRFLADVYYLPGSQDGDEILAKGIHLNQELLDKGLATPLLEY
jgi:endonuclease YncB( thermonuclease family)